MFVAIFVVRFRFDLEINKLFSRERHFDISFLTLKMNKMNNQIFCPKCGRPLRPGSARCLGCGATIPNGPYTPGAPVVPPIPTSPKPMPAAPAKRKSKGNSSSTVLVVVIVSAAVVVLSIIGLIVYLNYSKSVDAVESIVATTMPAKEQSASETTVERIVADVPDVEDEGRVEEQVAVSYPNVLPSGFTSVFDMPGLTPAKSDVIADVRSNCNNGGEQELTGTFSEYPIVMQLTVKTDGQVSGRYAYNSTLQKYGRGDSSWFKFKGQLLVDPSTDSVYMAIVTRNPADGKVFEYALLECVSMYSFSWSGRLCNIKYISEPFGHWYYLDVSRDN